MPMLAFDGVEENNLWPMFISAEHLCDPVPVENNPELICDFAELIRERMLVSYLPENMVEITFSSLIDEDTVVELSVWRDGDSQLVYEAKVEDQVTDWLGERVKFQREHIYRVNPTAMTAEFVVECEQYYDENEDIIEVIDEVEDEETFNTAHLAEITWLLERMPKAEQ